MPELLEIAQLGNPALREIAQPVLDLHNLEFQGFLDRLLATMLEGNGVGIAAPQVGRSLQALIVASRPNLRYPQAPLMEPVIMLNPQLLSHDDEVVVDWEGCLSIPGLRGQVPRYRAIEISYMTRDGKMVRQELTDFVARIFQHEFDHLSGKVYLDRVAQVQDLVTEQEYLKRVL
ncbi:MULTISPECIES: peptide deformylase [unclassified Leptolyngbya]|uniref:peptide deformylase n=1 Tax=unclassified Leptolyngbya TaxID=2650499 RepID=UPI001686EBA6|nr:MULTISPECIES: peptide deformylase [unclassified Leptolyngbya]MBD1911946.1 peptide deformylase [Leptolyngbya sp. FACHB-8]MBD2154247.1 peptide deformylase [Leptolyngbya sp. FACHB-16]